MGRKFYDEEAQAIHEDSDVSETVADGTVITLRSLSELRASSDADAALMIGAANACEIPMAYHDAAGFNTNATYIAERAATSDGDWTYGLTLPTNRGGKKLYISGFKVGVYAADGNDYLDQFRIYGVTHSALTVIHTDLGNATSQQEYSATFTAIDCSSYKQIRAIVDFVHTTNVQFQVSYVNLICYYDD